MNSLARCLALFATLLCACSGPKAPRPNVLLVTIDTLRRDHVSCYGYSRATTPNLDRIASEGVVFDNVSTPRAKTSPALASLFSGEYPHEHGLRDLLQPLDAKVPLLAEAFARAGYQSAAIIGNYVLQNRYCGFARGFDHYVESLPSRQGVPPDDVPQRTARSLTRAAMVALGFEPAAEHDEGDSSFEPPQALFSAERPWFLWLHYMDPHGAYEPPPEHDIFHSATPRWIDPAQPQGRRKPRISEYNIPPRARDAQGRFDAAAVIDLYDGEIHSADFELGRLLEALRARGDLAHTWIVITSDHGESLGEQDYWFEHGFYAYESACAVPLIVRPPDDWKARPIPGRRAGALSLCDLGPTISEWLELPPVAARAPQSAIHGVSRAGLLGKDDPAPFATFSEKIDGADLPGAAQTKAVRLGHYKLLRRWARGKPDAAGHSAALRKIGDELFDLRADPLEANDLAENPPSDAPLEELRGRLLEFGACDAPFEELEATLMRRRAALESSDANALRALKALGY